MYDNLLNNPKTFSQTEVIRALNIRKIFNASDVNWMMLMVFCIILLFLLCATLLFYNEIKHSKKRYLKPLLLVISLLVLVVTSLIIKDGFQSLQAVGGSPHTWGLMRLFYLCDGIIIMAAYLTHKSYEMINVVIFGVIQPVLIVFLFVMVLSKQRKVAR